MVSVATVLSCNRDPRDIAIQYLLLFSTFPSIVLLCFRTQITVLNRGSGKRYGGSLVIFALTARYFFLPLTLLLFLFQLAVCVHQGSLTCTGVGFIWAGYYGFYLALFCRCRRQCSCFYRLRHNRTDPKGAEGHDSNIKGITRDAGDTIPSPPLSPHLHPPTSNPPLPTNPANISAGGGGGDPPLTIHDEKANRLSNSNSNSNSHSKSNTNSNNKGNSSPVQGHTQTTQTQTQTQIQIQIQSGAPSGPRQNRVSGSWTGGRSLVLVTPAVPVEDDDIDTRNNKSVQRHYDDDDHDEEIDDDDKEAREKSKNSAIDVSKTGYDSKSYVAPPPPGPVPIDPRDKSVKRNSRTSRNKSQNNRQDIENSIQSKRGLSTSQKLRVFSHYYLLVQPHVCVIAFIYYAAAAPSLISWIHFSAVIVGLILAFVLVAIPNYCYRFVLHIA